MLSLNVSSMKNNVLDLKNAINQYEKYAMNIVKELQNSELDWKDDNSSSFFAEISTQKRDVERLVAELKAVKDKYVDIVDQAHKIASDMNKIFVNQNFKTIIMSRYDYAIDSLYGVRDSLNSQYMSFCTYYERSTVYSIANEIGKAASRLKSSKEKVDRLFTKLNALENNISASLGKIEIKVLSKVDVSAYMS